MSTETIKPTELKSETLWKIAQDECGAFECDREGIEDYSGMHFRHLGDLLRFAQLVIDRNDAAYARKIAAKQAIADQPVDKQESPGRPEGACAYCSGSGEVAGNSRGFVAGEPCCPLTPASSRAGK